MNATLNASSLSSTVYVDVYKSFYKEDNPYSYPPKNGRRYFSNTFYIGGESFSDSDEDDHFVFGANDDLNLIAGNVSDYNMGFPTPGEKIASVKALLYIRSDTLKLLKSIDYEDCDDETEKFNIGFIFDADVSCFVTIYVEPTEEFSNGIMNFSTPKGSQHPLQSQSYHFQAGSEVEFDEDFVIHPFSVNAKGKNNQKSQPSSSVVIVLTAEFHNHHHVLYANVEQVKDLSTEIVPKCQKQVIDGTVFLLKDLYFSRAKQRRLSSTTSLEEDQCVICFSTQIDSIILPCRHIKMCSSCSSKIIRQFGACPVCREKILAVCSITLLVDKAKPPSCSNDNTLSDDYKRVALGTLLSGLNSSSSRLTSLSEISSQKTSPSKCTSPTGPYSEQSTRKVVKVKKLGHKPGSRSHSSSFSDDMYFIQHHPQPSNSDRQTPISLHSLSESPKNLSLTASPRASQDHYAMYNNSNSPDDFEFPPPPRPSTTLPSPQRRLLMNDLPSPPPHPPTTLPSPHRGLPLHDIPPPPPPRRRSYDARCQSLSPRRPPPMAPSLERSRTVRSRAHFSQSPPIPPRTSNC